jgi:hypothetical protein
MYLVVIMTVLITVSVLYGISFLLPDTVPERTVMNPDLKDDVVEDTPDNDMEEKDVEEKDEKEPKKQEVPEFSSDCYDIITQRDGKIYLFKSKKPLEEGENPKIFSDLPTYRVWGEHMLYDGVRCPILHLDSSTKGYQHPEEKYPQEIPLVTANIIKGKQRKYEATISYETPGSMITDKPYLVHTPTNVNNYEYDLYKNREDTEENFMGRTHIDKSEKLYNASTDPSRYIAHDDIIRRSQHEGLDLGLDQSLPIPKVNFRDVPESEALRVLTDRDPYYKGAKLKRVGTSKYEVKEVQPEQECDTNDSIVNTGFLVSKKVPLDLLAYGGTLVPSGSIHGIY